MPPSCKFLPNFEDLESKLTSGEEDKGPRAESRGMSASKTLHERDHIGKGFPRTSAGHSNEVARWVSEQRRDRRTLYWSWYPVPLQREGTEEPGMQAYIRRHKWVYKGLST